MGVFDQPDNFPPILAHGWEILNSAGPMPMDSLKLMIAPKHFEATAHGSVETTLDLGLEMGVFKMRSGQIENDLKVDAGKSFQVGLRELLFNQNRNPIEKQLEQKGNLQLAIAWLMSFNISDMPGTFNLATVRQEKDFGTNPQVDWIIPNDTQWRVLIRWTEALGLSLTLPNAPGEPKVIRIDLTQLVRDFVTRNPIKRAIPALDFVDQLIEYCPVLPGGKVSEYLPERAKERTTKCSEIVAIALRRLEKERVIAFKKEDDTGLGTASFSLSYGQPMTIDKIVAGVAQ